MSENETISTTRRFELWWRKAQAWFATQFASINVDLTPVEEKLDEVKSDVAAVLEAVTGGGGIEIMTDDEYEPALEDLENMLDDIDVTDEN